MGILYEALKNHQERGAYPFHMPGHKRQPLIKGMEPFFEMDITEIEGFDDLQHPSGMLQTLQERGAKLFGAEETTLLINGSTAGILSALGMFERGDKILVARNCHKSVYHGIFLFGLCPIYLYPREVAFGVCGEILARDIEEALEKDAEIRGVVLVSPTYEGVVSDIKSIAQLVHKRGVVLIVDEAHGAHFGFHEAFPETANQQGADVVVQSLHKTLPALTQTGLLHFNGALANRNKIKTYLRMIQTTSPSYVLMSSIETCLDFLETEKDVFDHYVCHLKKMRASLKDLEEIQLLEGRNLDCSKVVLKTKTGSMTGLALSNYFLKHHNLQFEMSAGEYALAMTTVGDTEEGLSRLLKGAEKLNCYLKEGKKEEAFLRKGERPGILIKAQMIYTNSQVENYRKKESAYLEFEEAIGEISLEYAYLYPPGIPLLVPGERISQGVVEVLQYYMDCGYSIQGLKQKGKIEVL